MLLACSGVSHTVQWALCLPHVCLGQLCCAVWEPNEEWSNLLWQPWQLPLNSKTPSGASLFDLKAASARYIPPPPHPQLRVQATNHKSNLSHHHLESIKQKIKTNDEPHPAESVYKSHWKLNVVPLGCGWFLNACTSFWIMQIFYDMVNISTTFATLLIKQNRSIKPDTNIFPGIPRGG